MNILEKIDIFGIQIGLNYKQDGVYKTGFAQVNYTTSPSVLTEPGIIELNTNSYQIAVKIDQDDFITNPFYNVTFEQRHYIRYDNGTLLQNKLEPCTWDHFKDLPNLQYNWTDAFELQELSDFLCLQKNQTFQVGGKFENRDFYHLKFLVTECKNSSDTTRKWHPVCKTPEEIKDKQNDEDTRIDFLFTNYNLNPEKPEDTSQIFLDSMFFTFQPQYMYSTANIFITQKTMTTDNSLFPFENNSDEVFPIYSSGDYKQQYSVGNYTKYSEIFFLRSNYDTQINRAYQKIDQVISYIGGFCQMFLLVFAFVVRTYNSYHYQFELINRLYDFDLKSLDNDNNNDFHPNKTNPNKQRRASSVHSKNNSKVNPLESSVQINAHQSRGDKSLKDKRICQTDIPQQKIPYSSIDLEGFKNEKSQQYERGDAKGKEKFHDDKNYEFSILKEGISPILTRASPLKKIQLEKLQDSINQTTSAFHLNKILKKETSYPHQDELKKLKLINVSNKNISKELQTSNISTLNIQQSNIEHYHYNQYLPQAKQEENYYTVKMNQYNDGGFDECLNPALQITSAQALQIKKGLKFYNAQQFLEREITSYIRKENPIKMSFQYFINSITFGKFCNTPRIQLLNKANDMLSKDIDIYELIRSIKEIDKLKQLLLNMEQQSLFNFFPKPLISMKEDDSIPKLDYLNKIPANNKLAFNKLIYHQKTTSFRQIALVIKAINRFKMNLKNSKYSQMKKLFESYLKILNSQDPNNSSPNEINERLIKLLGKDLIKIFEATRMIYIKTEEQIYKEAFLAIQQNQDGVYFNHHYDITPIQKQEEVKQYFENQDNQISESQNQEQKEQSSSNQKMEEQNKKVQTQNEIKETELNLQQYQVQTDQNISALNITSLPFINNSTSNDQANIININQNLKNDEDENEIHQPEDNQEDLNFYQSYSINKNFDQINNSGLSKSNGFAIRSELNTPIQIIQKAKSKKNNYAKSPKQKKQK